MSDSFAPSEIVENPIEIGARHNAGWPRSNRNSVMRPFLIVATAWPLLCASPAFAQVEVVDPLTAMPSLGTTSPLGISPGGSVGAAGIPMDATEITSLGVSPAPTGSVTGTIAIPTSGAITTSGTTCSTGGMSPSGMYGSTASYDGGGMAPGTAAPATAATTGTMATLPTAATTDPTATPGSSTSSQMSVPLGTSTSLGMLGTSGMSGMCGSGSSSIASSSTPTSTSTLPTTPGGGARTGIPLGSMEISNLGVSSAPAVPTTGVLPIVGTLGPRSWAPTMPTLLPATASTATCGTTGGIGSAGIGGSVAAGAGLAGVTGTSISARLLRQSIIC